MSRFFLSISLSLYFAKKIIRVCTKLLDFFLTYHIYTAFIQQKKMRIIMVVLWLLFWSLGSVVITRFADGLTRAKLHGFFFGYSKCPHCKHRLHPRNLIPVVSYVVQWWKCVYCKKKISRIYPVLELLSAGIFLATYFLLKDFWTPILIFWLLTNRLLLLLLVYDLQKYELHMIVRILLMICWVLINIFAPGWNVRYGFLSALVFGWLFTAIYFFARRYTKIRFKKIGDWFGQGDIYLAVTIWMFTPLILTLSWILFSWWMLANVLILFVLLSSIIWLIWAWLQYLFAKIFGTRDLELGEWSISSSSLVPGPSLLEVIPFFPAMIISFWLITWKLTFFISLLFPLAW